jgi:hypothetical protein
VGNFRQSGIVLNVSDVLAAVFSLITFPLCFKLFKDPIDSFRLQRSSTIYRKAVYWATTTFVAPGLLLNPIILLSVQSHDATNFMRKPFLAIRIVQFVTFLVSTTVSLRMVNEFLLDNEIDVPYDPTLTSRQIAMISSVVLSSDGNSEVISSPRRHGSTLHRKYFHFRRPSCNSICKNARPSLANASRRQSGSIRYRPRIKS